MAQHVVVIALIFLLLERSVNARTTSLIRIDADDGAESPLDSFFADIDDPPPSQSSALPVEQSTTNPIDGHEITAEDDVNELSSSWNRRIFENVSVMPDSHGRRLQVPFNGRKARRESKDQSAFDVVFAGFPSTTDILHEFMDIDEHIDVAPTEVCATFTSPYLGEKQALRRLDDAITQMSSSSLAEKRGIACPTALYSYDAISRLEQHSPGSRLVVGVQHPVWLMEEFYERQLQEIRHNKGSLGEDAEIPTLHEVFNDSEPLRDVFLESSRYDLFLKQLGKTDLTAREMSELIMHEGYDLAILPNDIKIFLYSGDQIYDENKTRRKSFNEGLKSFLGLATPLRSLARSRPHVSGYICSSQYNDVRFKLIEQGSLAADWIIESFLKSDEVTVENYDHFVESVRSWGLDPCERVS